MFKILAAEKLLRWLNFLVQILGSKFGPQKWTSLKSPTQYSSALRWRAQKSLPICPARSHFWGQVLTPKFRPQITIAEATFLRNYCTNSYDSQLHSRRSTISGKFGKRLRSICLVVYIIGQNLPRRRSSLTADFFWGIVCARALAS